MLPVVQQCSAASLAFHGNVANVGKAADRTLDTTEARHASSVLTVLDNTFQELILDAVHRTFPHIRCIAEENTPMRRAFVGNDSEYVVILDPIDGTLHFQQGDAPYHISVGLACKGVMQAAVVTRPSESKIYTAIRSRGSYVQVGGGRPRRLQLPKRRRTSKAFISTKARAYQKPASARLQPREYPIGAALVLTELAEGELAAYLTRQVEIYDVGPPSLIAEEAGVRVFLGDGRTPTYDRKRKFNFFMAAADNEIRQFLLELCRRPNLRGKA
ncbi:MAG: inositol monophosphatase family protein [Candidatus Latescibacterota bacterium]|nr:inositol monophosphatase family protein [Candidatus Latescibacterota bacterium]